MQHFIEQMFVLVATYSSLNRFSTNDPYLYSLKTSERFSDVFRGYIEVGTWLENGLNAMVELCL